LADVLCGSRKNGWRFAFCKENVFGRRCCSLSFSGGWSRNEYGYSGWYILLIVILIIAHNLAWKLAVAVKGQAADKDKLLDSYTEEVYNLKFYLTLANSNYSENYWIDG
jgi:hypothetical protein